MFTRPRRFARSILLLFVVASFYLFSLRSLADSNLDHIEEDEEHWLFPLVVFCSLVFVLSLLPAYLRRRERVDEILSRLMPAVTDKLSDALKTITPVEDDSGRRKTRTVYVGSVPVGSEHRIALQTMTTSRTDDVSATVEQIKKCAESGADIVRLTVQGIKEANACEEIKRRVLEIPIVADIHFKPKVALTVSKFVDKVRINPGNFVDGAKTSKFVEISESAMFEALSPLISSLQKEGKSLRIGVNHGSLSERIVVQFGDTPAGMVASAIEIAKICQSMNFENIIFSMKSSNPRIMVMSYRLLVEELKKLQLNSPLHLGVTEAGGGIDGRIKSAVGIGSLLLEGIGDTIRVSLTEDPWLEIPTCKALRKLSEEQENFIMHPPLNPFEYQKRKISYERVFLNPSGSVFLISGKNMEIPRDPKGPQSPDVLIVQKWEEKFTACIQKDISVLIYPADGLVEINAPISDRVLYLIPSKIAGNPTPYLKDRKFALLLSGDESESEIASLSDNVEFFVLRPNCSGVRFVSCGRRIERILREACSPKPLVLWFNEVPCGDIEYDIVKGSASLGSLLLDGIGDAVIWEYTDISNVFSLMQACRVRSSKTEFISCPSCGRTLFDIQKTTERIQERLGHLPGVRIAVMGCIVNGPGEMADADFGYVGSVPGKVDLYKGKECVKRGVHHEEADIVLEQLIKESGLWKDK